MKLSMSMFASQKDLQAARQKQDAERYQHLKNRVFLEDGIDRADEWEDEIDSEISALRPAG